MRSRGCVSWHACTGPGARTAALGPAACRARRAAAASSRMRCRQAGCLCSPLKQIRSSSHASACHSRMRPTCCPASLFEETHIPVQVTNRSSSNFSDQPCTLSSIRNTYPSMAYSTIQRLDFGIGCLYTVLRHALRAASASRSGSSSGSALLASLLPWNSPPSRPARPPLLPPRHAGAPFVSCCASLCWVSARARCARPGGARILATVHALACQSKIYVASPCTNCKAAGCL